MALNPVKLREKPASRRGSNRAGGRKAFFSIFGVPKGSISDYGALGREIYIYSNKNTAIKRGFAYPLKKKPLS
jgi:hypothetical protein